ncbi:MAG: acetyl-CoA carboxylase biotin carboxylase subunit [Rhodothermia bacterium]|nr:MAG: acetyl-CoA carboxylase biotin carboxylase subunit [Rhodothermia bacterium]
MSDKRSIQKILIANRGEIAVRIIRTSHEMGMRSVAVYSDVDRTAPHVRMADEAYHVGASPSSESYLRQERLIAIAKDSGSDAIHPGYGFLAENADFAEKCEKAEIRFIGPPAEAIRMMGDKTAARAMMREAGVPMAPGTVDSIEDADEALILADEIGFPVLIKAAAGGGGKGMRIVHDSDSFHAAFEAAGREALSAFGDSRVFIEKYIVEPRHIEFQIMADQQGNIVHLFERECSIQRRHQKVIEEAPSPIMTPQLRKQMGQAAIDAARSCGYVGAGTVEFLVDADGKFYFMEMNTRLQVEHAVTEWITGLDLVRIQILIAEGCVLPWKQEDLSIHGHSIECRIYAEDPSNNFLPGPGLLVRHQTPDGFGVRVDSGVEQGDEVSTHYDPMISKVTSWGADRSKAIERMRRALREYEIAGVPTTISFCLFVLEHESFRSGIFSTHFVDQHFNGRPKHDHDPGFEEILAKAAVSIWSPGSSLSEASRNGSEPTVNNGFSSWRKNRGRPRRLPRSD